ncbi:unnamed protein product [Leptidea sinapis]|uniref:Uncharacterized protein n=1 Tax=Leptidea sinapis TaxID=189913 RepID=A0A5E4QMK9_9NEOP|nr:unnamed protein product [Leptidea sinapis]
MFINIEILRRYLKMQAIQSLHSIACIQKCSRTKVYRKRIDPFSLGDEVFLKRYRFSKQTAKVIINLVREELELNRKGCGTSPELQQLPVGYAAE